MILGCMLTVGMATGGCLEIQGMEVFIGLQSNHVRWVEPKNPANPSKNRRKKVKEVSSRLWRHDAAVPGVQRGVAEVKCMLGLKECPDT